MFNMLNFSTERRTVFKCYIQYDSIYSTIQLKTHIVGTDEFFSADMLNLLNVLELIPILVVVLDLSKTPKIGFVPHAFVCAQDNAQNCINKTNYRKKTTLFCRTKLILSDSHTIGFANFAPIQAKSETPFYHKTGLVMIFDFLPKIRGRGHTYIHTYVHTYIYIYIYIHIYICSGLKVLAMLKLFKPKNLILPSLRPESIGVCSR